jgi:uncharacterized membrane protein YuzA (DUF378 family)
MLKSVCGGHKVAWILLIIGGLNWGLVGVFGLDLVEWALGGIPWLARLVYILVGVSALMMLAAGKCCMKDGKWCACGKCADCKPQGDMPKANGMGQM